MKFEKLNGRNRRTLAHTSGTYVLEKESDLGMQKELLNLWLGTECQYQKTMLFFCIKLAKRSFFEKNPRCKYALLIGFNREWAQGIEK